MGKVISFELKKLVSRIGIYILVLLMAGLLVAGVFMYKPTKRDMTPLSLAGETVSDMYNSFNNDLKQNYINKINTVAEDALTYVTSSNNYQKYNNKDNINALFTQFDNYCLMYSQATNASSSEYQLLLQGINMSLDSLVDALDEVFNDTYSQNPNYYILTTNNNYYKLKLSINNIKQNFTKNVISHTLTGEKYYKELRAPLYNSLQNLIYPQLNETASKYISTGTYHTLITSRMDEIVTKINLEYNKAINDTSLQQDKSIKNELNALFNRYANCAEVFVESYNSSMCADALNTVSSKSKRADLYGYKDVSLYQQEENALLYQYYIENNKTPVDFATGLSVTHTSNGKINCYDFTFFIMSLFAVVVMIYVIYLSAHTISGEINNNTMRFTALRPIKRSSLFMGKYLAIMLMAFILLMFGTITSLIVGGIVFGFNSSNILMIVNGLFVFNAHPIIAISIFVLSSLFIAALYSALTMVLSVALKSDLLSMIISVMIYVVNLILPLFFGTNSWLKFNPFTNINLFAYFGTTRLTSDSVLAKLFNSVVYQGMNLWISLIYIVGIITILLLIGRHLFKRREL